MKVLIDLRKKQDSEIYNEIENLYDETLRSEERRVGKECLYRWGPYN